MVGICTGIALLCCQFEGTETRNELNPHRYNQMFRPLLELKGHLSLDQKRNRSSFLADKRCYFNCNPTFEQRGQSLPPVDGNCEVLKR
jgi:hypothetical protein